MICRADCLPPSPSMHHEVQHAGVAYLPPDRALAELPLVALLMVLRFPSNVRRALHVELPRTEGPSVETATLLTASNRYYTIRYRITGWKRMLMLSNVAVASSVLLGVRQLTLRQCQIRASPHHLLRPAMIGPPLPQTRWTLQAHTSVIRIGAIPTPQSRPSPPP